jgi:hypothetical protein
MGTIVKVEENDLSVPFPEDRPCITSVSPTCSSLFHLLILSFKYHCMLIEFVLLKISLWSLYILFGAGVSLQNVIYYFVAISSFILSILLSPLYHGG